MNPSKTPINTLYLLLTLFFAFPSLLAQSNSGQLDIELVIPISTPTGERILSLDRYPRFHVLLKNNSQTTLNLWKDWNSWGFFNLSVIVKFPDGEKVIRKVRPTKWDGDFPDFWQLNPGESVAMEVDMSTGEWKGFPDLYGESVPATLKVIYENKADILATEYGIWIGKLESKELNVIFR